MARGALGRYISSMGPVLNMLPKCDGMVHILLHTAVLGWLGVIRRQWLRVSVVCWYGAVGILGRPGAPVRVEPGSCGGAGRAKGVGGRAIALGLLVPWLGRADREECLVRAGGVTPQRPRRSAR